MPGSGVLKHALHGCCLVMRRHWNGIETGRGEMSRAILERAPRAERVEPARVPAGPGPDPRAVAALERFAAVANALVILIPCEALVGWALGIETLKRVFPGMIEMNPVSAVNLILLGG